MKTAISSIAKILILAATINMSGCSTPHGVYVPAEEEGVASVDLQEMDYQLACHHIVQKMLKAGLPKGYVVTLGPVDTHGTRYSVDINLIQDKIETMLKEEGSIQFTILKKALTDGKDAFDEMNKIAQYDWENQHSADMEAIQKFKWRARINGIIYGRVSSIEPPVSGMTEITYTFVWRLANIDTGLVDMTFTDTLRKNVRR